jgi:hypothetical protein
MQIAVSLIAHAAFLRARHGDDPVSGLVLLVRFPTFEVRQTAMMKFGDAR